MANKDTRQSISSAAPIRLVDNGDGTYSVATSITGSLTNDTFISALAIADTNSHISGNENIQWIDVSCKFGRKRLVIESTLNQAANITILGKRSGSSNIFYFNTAPISVSGIASMVDSTAANQIIGLDAPITYIGIKIQCTTAPTSGSISAYLESYSN